MGNFSPVMAVKKNSENNKKKKLKINKHFLFGLRFETKEGGDYKNVYANK